mgnify:CR=1 FL=1
MKSPNWMTVVMVAIVVLTLGLIGYERFARRGATPATPASATGRDAGAQPGAASSGAMRQPPAQQPTVPSKPGPPMIN